MKKLFLVAAAAVSMMQAETACDIAKADYNSYYRLSASEINYNLKAQLIGRAIDALKRQLDTCFISGMDKAKYHTRIDELEKLQEMYRREAERWRAF